MPATPAEPFGALLRRHRLAAGLSQAELAERARLSVRSISDLERGARRSPYPHTLRQLAASLGLDAAERARLAAAARSPVAPGAPENPEPPRLAAPAGGDRADAAGPRTNLPLATTSFVGREREVAEVRRLLGTTRLLTLTGAGGVGKTRLALEVARDAQADYPDGVWLVELAALADGALAPAAAAAALGVPERPGQPIVEALQAALRPRRLLLALDNCEHLLDACAALADALLRGCPDVRVLATSRAPLAVAGEVTWRAPSLALPDPQAAAAPAALADVAAVRLFLDRATAALPDFRLTERNAPAVAAICARLDGIPLALELAAARVRLLSVEQIAARLGDAVGLLVAGSRTHLPRQRTLRATLDWSHALLGERERALFRRLAVFAGGWTVEAAEAVGAGEGLAAGAVLDLLGQLVDQSLVQREKAEGAARYRLLEPVRQYALERLREAGEEAAVRGRHFAWCLALAEQAEPALRTPNQLDWLARLDAEHDNLRAALGWCRDDTPQAGLRLAGLLGHFWRVRHHNTEGRRWLESLLARAPERSAPRITALVRAAVLAREQGDLMAARARLDEALTIGRALGDARSIAWALQQLGSLHKALGDLRSARAYLEEGLVLLRSLPGPSLLGAQLFMLGELEDRQGNYDRARALLQESLTELRAVGDRWPITVALMWLASLTLHEGDAERAAALLEEALALAQELGVPLVIAWLRRRLGQVAHWQGDLERAAALYHASLTLARDLADRPAIAWPLALLGRVAHLQGDATRATALLEESLAMFEEIGEGEGIGAALRLLGLATASRGDPGRATERLRASLTLRREMGERLGIAECLEGLAAVAAGQGQPARAARWLRTAEALREAIGAPLPPVELHDHEATVQAARAALGEAAVAAAWVAGRQLAPGEVIADALGEEPAATATAADTPAPVAPRGAGPLTAREVEVVALVAGGLNNRQIAAELSIAERTVGAHLTNIMGKLAFTSRVQVATWAVARGLGRSGDVD